MHGSLDVPHIRPADHAYLPRPPTPTRARGCVYIIIAFKDHLGGHAQVLGISIFAYSYVVTIPSWVNEKHPSVSVNKAVWVPAAFGLGMKLLTGLLGAWAYSLVLPDGEQRPNSDDILNILSLPNQPKVGVLIATTVLHTTHPRVLIVVRACQSVHGVPVFGVPCVCVLYSRCLFVGFQYVFSAY